MNVAGGAGCEKDSGTREVLEIGPAASRNAIENGGVAGEASPEAVRHRADTEVEDLAAVPATLVASTYRSRSMPRSTFPAHGLGSGRAVVGRDVEECDARI